MSRVIITGIDFRGKFENKIPAFCPRCGQTDTSIPFKGMNELSLSNLSLTCLRCGGPIEVQAAYYKFERQVFDILSEGNLTRQQARRFAKKAAKTDDINTLKIQSELINPKLAEATELAIQEPNPKNAVQTIVAIAVFLASAATAVVSADDLYDRYSKGELFEKHSPKDTGNADEGTIEDPKEKPDRKRSNEESMWKGTEV